MVFNGRKGTKLLAMLNEEDKCFFAIPLKKA